MEKAAKTSLELGARHAEVVQSAIKHWVESSAISQSQASLLVDTIVVRGFDWEKFAKYTLRLAVLCLAVAVSSVVFEDSFRRIYRRIMALPPSLRGAATGVVAMSLHVFAHRRSQHLPGQKYANEAIHAVGALFFALAAFQLVEQLQSSIRHATQSKGDADSQTRVDEDDEKDQGRIIRKRRERERQMGNAERCVMLGLATLYGTVAVISKSNLIWSCSMIVLGYCCGGVAGYMYGTYSIGMDLPLVFIAFGSSLLGVARLMRSYALTTPLWSTTRTWGLLYLFISLWIMSIYGYDKLIDSRGWAISQRARVFLWSVVFLVAAGASIWHGLRFDDPTTKGFGLTFLGINLYTKFFEFFWGWSKPVFFAVLAGTLAVVGRYTEDVWNTQV